MAKVNLQFAGVFDQPGSDLDKIGLGHSEARRRGQPRGQEFIGKHTQVLRVVLELHDIHLAVGAEHEMPLRPASHSPDLLHCQNRQAAPIGW